MKIIDKFAKIYKQEKYKNELLNTIKTIREKEEGKWRKEEKSLAYEARIIMQTYNGIPKKFDKNAEKKWKDITEKEIEKWIYQKKDGWGNSLKKWIRKNVPKDKQEMFIHALNALLSKFT